MLATIGAVETMAVITRTAARAVPGTCDPGWSSALVRWRSDLPSTTELLDGHLRAEGRFAIPGDPDWPAALDDLGEARPYGLWIRGSANLTGILGSAIAVVGARAATPYGTGLAAEFAIELSEHSYTIISGGAYGIDAAAHRGALATDGPTVAVLAGGLDRPYPPAHAGLFDQIARGGLLVSEAPPGQNPHRAAFLERNRIIIALARATVVIEASMRSGSMRAAAEARELGRPLFAVPGPVNSVLSVGPHGLLADGARIATCADSILRHLPGHRP